MKFIKKFFADFTNIIDGLPNINFIYSDFDYLLNTNTEGSYTTVDITIYKDNSDLIILNIYTENSSSAQDGIICQVKKANDEIVENLFARHIMFNETNLGFPNTTSASKIFVFKEQILKISLKWVNPDIDYTRKGIQILFLNENDIN